MKKSSNLLIVAIALAIFSFSSCNNIKPKDVVLNNLNDSINYTLGQWQGDVFKQQYFPGDSTNAKLDAFIETAEAKTANGKAIKISHPRESFLAFIEAMNKAENASWID